MRCSHALAVLTLASALACTSGEDDTPEGPPERPAPVVPKPAPAPAPAPAPEDGPPAEETAPAGGWIQDEVIYDADGNVYGCVGGGNWCARMPALDPKTHKPRR